MNSILLLLLLLSHFSHVQLFATPWTAAYQAPLSMGFARQEYWSGLPLPSPPYSLLECKRHKLWYTYTMEYYSAIKRNKTGLFAEMWMDLKTIIENEVKSDREK